MFKAESSDNIMPFVQHNVSFFNSDIIGASVTTNSKENSIVFLFHQFPLFILRCHLGMQKKIFTNQVSIGA